MGRKERQNHDHDSHVGGGLEFADSRKKGNTKQCVKSNWTQFQQFVVNFAVAVYLI